MTTKESGRWRVCIKDIDTRKILLDEMFSLGQTITIPDGYDVVTEESNAFGEDWYYVRKKVQ